MRVLTLLSLAAVVMPFVVRAQDILPLWFWLGGQSIFQGYWHNWCHQIKQFAPDNVVAGCMQLRHVPDYYNVIAVAYMNSTSEGDIPTFTVDWRTGMNADNFPKQVIELNTREHKTAVIISLGGPNSNISLISTQKNGLKDQFIRLAETYGFNGVDVNLERSVLDVADNADVITGALKEAKYHFSHNQYYNWATTYYTPAQNFIITMSGQVSFRCLDSYKVYLRGLDGVVDYIITKFFDYDTEDNAWLMHVNEDLTKGIPYADLSLETVFQKIPHAYALMNVCYEIPNDMSVHGTIVNAFPGGHRNSNNIKITTFFQNQIDQGIPMRGIACWSINWDNARYSNGTRIDNAFAKLHGPWIRGFESSTTLQPRPM